jgi:hypothetical protein
LQAMPGAEGKREVTDGPRLVMVQKLS